MPGTVLGKEMNYGFLGTIARHGDEVSRTFKVHSSSANIYFGDPVAIKITGTDVQVVKVEENAPRQIVIGIAMRRVKSAKSYKTPETGYYAPGEYIDVLIRGSIIVKTKSGWSPRIGYSVGYINATSGTSSVGDLVVVDSHLGTGKRGKRKYKISTNAVSGDKFDLFHETFTAGTDYEVGATTADTAANIVVALHTVIISPLLNDGANRITQLCDIVYTGGDSFYLVEKDVRGYTPPQTTNKVGTIQIVNTLIQSAVTPSAIEIPNMKWAGQVPKVDSNKYAELVITERKWC